MTPKGQFKTRYRLVHSAKDKLYSFHDTKLDAEKTRAVLGIKEDTSAWDQHINLLNSAYPIRPEPLVKVTT